MYLSRAALRERLIACTGVDTSIRPDKDDVRARHEAQRIGRSTRERHFAVNALHRCERFFASGDEVVPDALMVSLEVVAPRSLAADLFRLASLLWSVPVSRGVGRRQRFLVWDRTAGRLIGLFALGSPVFNLSPRDRWIGWKGEARLHRLGYVYDAFVLGAVPPYNQLLCGKLVAALTASAEVRHHLAATYDGEHPLVITVTSALGRSSLYNRLVLTPHVRFASIGWTAGLGHFHIPDELLSDLRAFLAAEGHPYARQHCFDGGGNWRMRLLRAAVDELGLQAPAVLQHGIRREVFAAELSTEAKPFLNHGGQIPVPQLSPAATIAQAACERWVIPRSRRRPDYVRWRREDTMRLFDEHLRVQEPIDGYLASKRSGIVSRRCGCSPRTSPTFTGAWARTRARVSGRRTRACSHRWRQ